MNFGERLEQLLEERELTQRQASVDLHIAATTLNGYIKGIRQPDYTTLIGIAEYFQVSTDYLLGVTNVRSGAPETLDVKEGDLVGIYRSLESEKQALLIEQAHLYHKFDLKQKAGKKKK